MKILSSFLLDDDIIQFIFHFFLCLGGSAPLAELENDDIDQKYIKQRKASLTSSEYGYLTFAEYFLLKC